MTRRRAAAAAPAPLAVVYRALADLQDDPANTNTHSSAQIEQLAKIMRVRWTQPILIDEGDVIFAGHARKLAGLKAGYTDGPTILIAGLSEDEKRALRIADNAVARQSEWNMDLLRQELGLLQGAGFDLALTGFTVPDLASLFNRSAGLTDPDEAPPAPAVPVSRTGDLWLCGRHRVLCGDATDRQTVTLLLDPFRAATWLSPDAVVAPHLMVTDPPYGVSYDADWRRRAGIGSVGAASGVVSNDDRADWSAAWTLFPGAVAYVWHGGLHSATADTSLISVGFQIRAQIIWVKTRPVISRGAYHWQHEPALYVVRPDAEDDGWTRFAEEHEVAGYAVRAGKTARWEGGRKQSTVWFIEHLKSDTGHSTQKPVECMKRPIENNSKPGDAVYDPFLGSGTTLIAAEMTARNCVGLEIDPAYVDVCVARWSAFVGKEAVLAATGETFGAVSRQRLGGAEAPKRARRKVPA